MAQTVTPLANDLLEHNEKQRAWVKGHFTENADVKYEPLVGKLRLLDGIISQNFIQPDETWKLQALGIVFGDALVQQLGMEWVTVEDEYGRDPAVRYPGTSVLAFPLTTISKRIEGGETIDVYDLFNGLCEMIRARVAEESPEQT
jgi:hypothetical protein